MTELLKHPMTAYIRPGAEVTAFCPGCGDGILAQSILQAIDDLEISMDEFIFVSGIGCAGWIPSPYFYADTLHTTHGRPIAFATGVKLMRPDLRVMVISGDGDLSAIGGNHLIHAARRNIDLVTICVNNSIYGMTGGQVAPTTPIGIKTVTTPYGNSEREFDLCALVTGAGATYVARWTTHHPRFITRSVKKAIRRKGFSFIEVISQCPVHYGRRSGEGDAVAMMMGYKERSINARIAHGMAKEELVGKIVVGELVEIEGPELSEGYRQGIVNCNS